MERGASHSHIRSFAVRATRMSQHQKRSWETLYGRYCITSCPEAVNIRACFPQPLRCAPLIVEVGFGMGDATAEYASAHPDQAILGIEVHRPGVGKLMGRLEAEHIENVRIIPEDAMPVLRIMLAGTTAAGMHILFPDPWPKKRHHKRRLVRPSFAPVLRDRLSVGGYLWLATDWDDYAHQMRSVLDAVAGLENRFGGFAPRPSWRPETAFERKGVMAGRRIFDLCYERSW